MSKPIAGVLVLVGLSMASKADAQYVVGRRPITPMAPSYSPYPAPASVSAYSSYAASPAPVTTPGRLYSYSYYTLSPLPARTYVGYGSGDFPFHGVPYGHPYDPWTWPMMSGYYANGLTRYYDPPVK